MNALITLVNGDENITIASNEVKLDDLLKEFIRAYIKRWDKFDSLQEAPMLNELLTTGSIDDIMELFNDLASKYDEYVFVKFAPVKIIIDA